MKKKLTPDMLRQFHLDLMADETLKPSDRIAAARRLEALLGDNEHPPAAITVTLHLDEETVTRVHREGRKKEG